MTNERSQEYTSRYSTQFKSDGTVETTGYRNIDTGTYEVVGENTIQATFDQNYFESAGQSKQLIEGYTYTVLYTYDETKIHYMPSMIRLHRGRIQQCIKWGAGAIRT